MLLSLPRLPGSSPSYPLPWALRPTRSTLTPTSSISSPSLAGDETTAKAAEITDGLRSCDIKHIAFKPGSPDGIRQAVAITAANPDFPIIMQWTGGRAGGHHSISLADGSGSGNGESVWPCMSGEWSAASVVQPMPHGGVFSGSWAMIAREPHTSESVKKLPVQAPGADDDRWENILQGRYRWHPHRPVRARRAIHKIASRAVKLWKEFDELIFKLPKQKRAAQLPANADMVIKRPSRDFARPWFGQKKDGTVVKDLGDMTYEEAVPHLVRLVYMKHQSRWVAPSLRNLPGYWPRRVGERSAGVNGKPRQSISQSYNTPNHPGPFVTELFETYPAGCKQLLAAEDRKFFLLIASPSPPYPDSLWAAEDIGAVFNQDPQPVAILQGSVAVKHARVASQPTREMLRGVKQYVIKKLLETQYSGDESRVPTIDYTGSTAAAVVPGLAASYGAGVSTSGKKTMYKSGSSLPPTNEWPETLVGHKVHWLRALFCSENIVQAGGYVSNPLKRLFAPRNGQTVIVAPGANRVPTSAAFYGSARSFGVHQPTSEAVTATFSEKTNAITVVVNEELRGSSIPLEFTFGRNERIKAFYWCLWYGENEVLPSIGIHDKLAGPEVTSDAAAVERLSTVAGNQGEKYRTTRMAEVEVPMDFAIVTGWQYIMRAIFPDAVDGDLLKLVHLSSAFKILEPSKPFKVGDKCCTSKAQILSVTSSNSGKTVSVVGKVPRDRVPMIEAIDEPDYAVELNNAADAGVLQSKEWFDWDDNTRPLLPGTRLIFPVTVCVRDQLKTLIPVATADYTSGVLIGNPVTGYLQRHSTVQGHPVLSESPYTLTSPSVPSSFTSPATSEPYSKISGDFNPIHINPYFTDYASLPGAITRGMRYDVNLIRMVLPGDELSVKLSHIGMNSGNRVIKVETVNQRGEKIIEGTAEVAQPPEVYFFTGQGSQEPGVGMDLYASSPAACAVWDAADEHLTAVYGFSIIELVKQNPKEKTIHFGGIKGQAIRQRYIDMTHGALDREGNVKILPLFADINMRTQCYTFSHPAGLLFVAQFAQIALVVTKKAAFNDMRSKGLVQNDSAFAGHSRRRAVERDHLSRSNYATCAVNPSRSSHTFNKSALREVIGRRTNALIEIVNYSGETRTSVLKYLKKENIAIEKLTRSFTLAKIREMLTEIIDNRFEVTKKQEAAVISPSRMFLSRPLCLVSAHPSTLATSGLKNSSAHLNPYLLINKYIPNLIAKPFQVTNEYIQDQTMYPRLDKVIKARDKENWGVYTQLQKLTLPILAELLAYQFASPVRWIETQDLPFAHYRFKRFIELGPGPNLTGMATSYPPGPFEDEALEEPADKASEPAPACAAALVAIAAAPVTAPGGPVAAIAGKPINAIDVLHVIIA
ncbi:hypothetical protein DL93DRAFT_2102899 [Clavulina sp. PMI_390]|nr:hypothetical protein DL93DRAFT_2102899 [Clavulina sp. PMI_390]